MSRLSVEVISYMYVDSEGPPGVHDGHAIALIEVLAVYRYVRSSRCQLNCQHATPAPAGCCSVTAKFIAH